MGKIVDAPWLLDAADWKLFGDAMRKWNIGCVARVARLMIMGGGALVGAWMSALVADPLEPIDDGVQVAVLGYHDFSASAEETHMIISTQKFRRQMERLAAADVEVISMADFQAWKAGEKSLPERCALITIDDGWKSVYTEAYPILKEFGYPFTLFLYKNYVDGGGRALTTGMIREMMTHGATIGSHSVSHPYPATVKSHRAKGPDAYDQFLRQEMGESKRFLEAKFGEAVTVYAYPGGYHTKEMHVLAEEFGYRQLFTVIPGKVRRGSDPLTLPRYVVLGTHDPIFEMAMDFGASGESGAGIPGVDAVYATMVPVKPQAGEIVGSRLPRIEVDFSEEPVDPDTLVMKVGGFGVVPANWDPDARTYAWQCNRRLRISPCRVEVNWKDDQGNAPEQPLKWSFQIDHEAAYVPRE